MLLLSIALFILCFFILLKAADYAINYSTRLAALFSLSKFVISFFIVAFVSSLPESLISVLAQLNGDYEVALTALLGSNVADLSFIFGAVAFFAGGLRIESAIIKRDVLYLGLMLLPFLLGFDGTITRLESGVLLMCGLFFFYAISQEHGVFRARVARHEVKDTIKVFSLLVISLLVMTVSARYTILYVSEVAQAIGISRFIITLLVVGIGTCLPELIFTIKSVRKNHDDLALGNILGVVMIDATIMLGIVGLIHPVVEELTPFRVITLWNGLAALSLLFFIKVKKKVTRWEGSFLLIFYGIFVAVMLFLEHFK